MSFYRLGDSFKWFVGRVSDIKDPERMGRVKVRVIHEQTGELGKQDKFGISDEDLLWAYPISAIQSASLHWRKIKEEALEGFDVPDWIDAVGLSPTGIAIGTYVYGFYLDGHEQNIPLIFGTYHKLSTFPEPPSSPQDKMLQLDNPQSPKQYNDVAALARGNYFDEETLTFVSGQSLPKTPYIKGNLVSEPKSAYSAEYPYNTTYTTKSGHAIELDDTPSHERVHVWHNSGSYEEIANIPESDKQREVKGRRVQRTKDDLFQIVDRNKESNIANNHHEQIGNNEVIQIANDQLVTIGNNQVVIIANNQTVGVGNNQNITVGANCTINVGNNCNVIVDGHINIIAAKGISINAGRAGITVNRGPLHVVGTISSATCATGEFTSPDGKLIVVKGGIITEIVESSV